MYIRNPGVKFPGADAYYSYRTCGQSNEFALWSQSLAEGTTSAPQVPRRFLGFGALGF